MNKLDIGKYGVKISNKDYRNANGISSTDLKWIAKSPAHFKYKKLHPPEDTPALLFGRAAHKYMLEKEDFFNEFAVAPVVDRRTKDGKAKWQLFIDQNDDKDIISNDSFMQIEEMREVLYSTPFVGKLLSGDKEMSYFLEDEVTGVLMKCRPDCTTEIGDTCILIDYKTTDSADSDDFMRQAIKLMYDLQMAYYKDILDALKGKQHSVIFIAQEKTPPYCVNILEANDYFIRSGRDMYRSMLNTYAECKETGNWYGYMQGSINSLGLPIWLQKQYEI